MSSQTEHIKQLKQLSFEQIVKREMGLLKRDGNGIHAWRIYKKARTLNRAKEDGRPVVKVEIPEAVLQYFDDCAQHLTSPGGTKSSCDNRQRPRPRHDGRWTKRRRTGGQ